MAITANDPNEIPAPDEYLESVFGGGGYLAQHFNGYAPRDGQIALAQAVDSALQNKNDRRHLLAEGPTGTGKSLAYLVPATFWSAMTDTTVVIATANIALQEQLVQKDLPLLKEILPWPFEFALLKGLNNYLCLDKVDDRSMHGELFRGTGVASVAHLPVVDSTSPEAREKAIEEWAAVTQTGDRNELTFQPGAEWAKFSVGSEDCRGKKCERYKECFGHRAKQEARKAQVIVTNFALLFAHLSIRRMTDGMAGALPEYDHLILDEAHKAADTARDYFGFSVARGAFKRAADQLRDEPRTGHGIDFHLADDVERTASTVFNDLSQLYRSRSYKTRLKEEGTLQGLDPQTFDEDGTAQPRELTPGTGNLLPMFEAVTAARNKAKSERSKLAKLFDIDAPVNSLSSEERKYSKRYDEIGRASARLFQAVGCFSDANEMADPNQVYFLEESQSGWMKLSSRQINVSKMLRDELFDSTAGSVILTSATLATGGDFKFLRKECGPPPMETNELIVESPFDWMSQALLVVPKFLPMPNEDSFASAICDHAVELIQRAKGRCLLLFTSYSKLRATHDRLKYAGLPYRLLVQGEKPRTQLVNEFKADESSVLLGTESFWAGVDVPGPALSAVMIDRIPFPTPDNPVLDAISDSNDRWFFDHSVPKAAVQLAQGVGRLIRSVDDRGIVMILDKRIVEKSYGRYFLNSMPKMLKSRSLDAIDDFLFPEEIDPFA